MPKMQRLTIILIGSLLLTDFNASAMAGDVFVVCNLGVALDKGAVRDLYLGEKHFAGTIKLDPIDNAAAQADFLGKVLMMDQSKYIRVWIKKSFRDGINPPQVLASDAEVLSYVKRTPGSCGYLATAPSPVVTVVARY